MTEPAGVISALDRWPIITQSQGRVPKLDFIAGFIIDLRIAESQSKTMGVFFTSTISLSKEHREAQITAF